MGKIHVIVLLVFFFVQSGSLKDITDPGTPLQELSSWLGEDEQTSVVLEDAPAPRADRAGGEFPNSRPESRTAGLEKLYTMARTFVSDWVQPYTIGDLIEDYDLKVWTDFADEEFYSQWGEWGWDFLGFACCLAVGVLFSVLVPFIGVFYCCGRCCCNSCCCCCCRTPKVGKTSKCKKSCCGFLLFGFTTMMLASGLLIFLTQDQLVQEVGPEGFFKDVIDSMDGLAKYVNNTVDQIEEIAVVDLRTATDDVIRRLEHMPDDTLEALENATQITTLLGQLETFVYSLEPLSTNLSQMVNSTETLKIHRATLDSNITEINSTLGDDLQKCIDGGLRADIINECTRLKDEVDSLKTEAQYDVNTTIALVASKALEEAIDTGILNQVESAIKAVRDIRDTVKNETEEVIDDVKQEVDEILKEVEDAFQELKDQVYEIDLDGLKDTVSETADMVYEYADEYYRWGYLVIVGIVLGIALLNYLGLAFGACCHKPVEGAPSGCCECTARQGGCFLLTAIALFFILGSILMLIVISFFAVGGSLEVFLCRHLVVYDDTMQSLERMAFESANINYSISIREVIDECKNDTAVYTALQLDNFFDIKNITDDINFDELLDKLKNLTISIDSDVTIVSPELNDTMYKIDEALKSVDYTPYEDQLKQDITTVDMRVLEADVLTLASAIDDAGHGGSLADDLRAEADRVGQVVNTTVTDMEQERALLSHAVDNASAITKSTDIPGLMTGLSAAEDAINSDVDSIIKEVIDDTAEDVVNITETYVVSVVRAVEEDLGGCRPIYDTLESMTYATCIYFLYPFNAMWFCLGWFLFCCVFTLVIGTKMGGYFRQQVPKQVIPYHHTNAAYQADVPRGLEPMPDYIDDLPPDYDTATQVKAEKKKDDFRHPGVKKTKSAKAAASVEPPPDYNKAMKKHKKEAQAKNKELKEERKKGSSESDGN